jgi:hypothetical protein
MGVTRSKRWLLVVVFLSGIGIGIGLVMFVSRLSYAPASAPGGTVSFPSKSTSTSRPTSVESVRVPPNWPHGDAFRRERVEFGATALELEPGEPEEGEIYYAKIASILGFDGGTGPRDLDALLDYCGYKGLRAADIERLDSSVLQDFEQLRKAVSNQAEFEATFGSAPFQPGDVLASRFFAPKITDVSGAGARTLGWRKLVRLRIRSESAADTHQVATLHLLFNFFSSEDDLLKGVSPFAKESVNNQAILTRVNGEAFFLVYDRLSGGGLLTDHLTASFDARDPNIGPDRKYFVPRACAVCHGGSKPKLSLLDTDYWFDRVQDGDDFSSVKKTPHGVLFDGGKIETDGGSQATTAAFDSAFKTLQVLNQEIEAQNAAVDGAGIASLHRRASRNWVQKHATTTSYLRPIARGITTASTTWTAGNPLDEALVPRLSRFCYRCHSTAIFNVFEKTAVRGRWDKAVELLRQPDIKFRMPQDRNLTPADVDDLVQLFEKLGQP